MTKSKFHYQQDFWEEDELKGQLIIRIAKVLIIILISIQSFDFSIIVIAMIIISYFIIFRHFFEIIDSSIDFVDYHLTLLVVDYFYYF